MFITIFVLVMSPFQSNPHVCVRQARTLILAKIEICFIIYACNRVAIIIISFELEMFTIGHRKKVDEIKKRFIDTQVIKQRDMANNVDKLHRLFVATMCVYFLSFLSRISTY